MNQPYYQLTLAHIEENGTYTELLDVKLPDAAAEALAQALAPVIREFGLGLIADAVERAAERKA